MLFSSRLEFSEIHNSQKCNTATMILAQKLRKLQDAVEAVSSALLEFSDGEVGEKVVQQAIQEGNKSLATFTRKFTEPKTKRNGRALSTLPLERHQLHTAREYYCLDFGKNTQERFLRAVRSILRAPWLEPEQCQHVWASAATHFPVDGDPIVRLLRAYPALSTAHHTAHRMYAILVADAIEGFMESSQNGAYGEYKVALQWLSDATGMEPSTVRRLEREGGWLMSFCEKTTLGALFMLGDEAPQFGHDLTEGHHAPLADLCRDVEGFSAHARKLIPTACSTLRQGLHLIGREPEFSCTLPALLATNEAMLSAAVDYHDPGPANPGGTSLYLLPNAPSWDSTMAHLSAGERISDIAPTDFGEWWVLGNTGVP